MRSGSPKKLNSSKDSKKIQNKYSNKKNNWWPNPQYREIFCGGKTAWRYKAVRRIIKVRLCAKTMPCVKKNVFVLSSCTIMYNLFTCRLCLFYVGFVCAILQCRKRFFNCAYSNSIFCYNVAYLFSFFAHSVSDLWQEQSTVR